MLALNDLFDQFLKERIYLHNITPKTRERYQNVWLVFCRWRRTLPERSPAEPVITRGDLHTFVVSLRERGVRPISCNCCMRGINAFCKWLHQQGMLVPRIRQHVVHLPTDSKDHERRLRRAAHKTHVSPSCPYCVGRLAVR